MLLGLLERKDEKGMMMAGMDLVARALQARMGVLKEPGRSSGRELVTTRKERD